MRPPLQLDDPVLPPLDGSVNFAEAVDFNLEHNKSQPFYVFSPRENPQDLVYVSHLEFSRACHRVGHIVRPERQGDDREVVAILGLADTITYQTTVLGVMRAGWVPFPISSRNTAPAVVHLLRESGCHRIMGTEHKLKSLFDDIKDELSKTEPEFPLHIQEIPAIETLYPYLGQETEEHCFTPYPPEIPRPPLRTLAMYLHSSGSTGYPKVIPQTFEIFSEWSNYSCKILRMIRNPRVRYGAMALPAFHTMGISTQLLYPVYGITCTCIYPPVVHAPEDLPIMPTSDNAMGHMKLTKANIMITVPAILHMWVQSDDAIEMLKGFIAVSYAGGPLLPKVGAKLYAAGVKLGSLYGTTEIGGPTLLPMERPEVQEEWEWIKFSDRTTINWVDQGNDTYECQFLTTEIFHPSVENMSNPGGYATSDVFMKHPTIPDLWKIVGRKDDVIIHSSGEKTVPGPIEETIQNNARAWIAGIVMFGRKHDQAGILVEPSPQVKLDRSNNEEVAAFRNSIWPAIEEANKIAPTFSRIYKEMVIITEPYKPLPRSEKDTVARKAALRVYDAEIEDLYATIEAASGGQKVAPPQNWEVDAVVEWLTAQASEIFPQENMAPTVNLFEQGFDSLSATFLRLRIVNVFRVSDDLAKVLPAITQNVVYDHPTVDDLARFITGIVKTHDAEIGNASTSHKEAVGTMINKYIAGLDSKLPLASHRVHEGAVVLITGSTGNIGSQILSELLQDNSVARVYAFNRAAQNGQTSLRRHEERFKEKGLDCTLLRPDRVTFVEGAVGEGNLGLTDALYRELQYSVTHIIHGAWRLDFNLTLASFESHIRGTRNFIDFARSSPLASNIRFIFLSSVAAAQSWDASVGPYPEEFVEDVNFALGGGYGESKYVSEMILAKSGLNASSLRIGQVSGGSPNGAWATTDWLPIIVKSSLMLGVLPNSHGLVSWVPMDAVARIVLDVTFAKDPPPAALNVVHPRPVPWNQIMHAISDALYARSTTKDRMPLVSLGEWVERVEDHLKNANGRKLNINDIPAIKLLDFYRKMAKSDAEFRRGASDGESGGLATFNTTKAQSVSETMRTVKPIGSEDANRWVDFWCSYGYFS